MAASLAGKVAVVTGASSGIGWALAKELAAEGCRVGLIARRAEPLQALAADIAAAGGAAVAAAADVGRREQVAAAVESVRGALGPIDLAIANAGIGRPTLLDPVNVYMDGLRIHLRGTGLKATTICPGFVKTPMTASNRFHMPQLMEADYAARRIVRAIKAGKKVYNFPQGLHLMTKLSRWVPDRFVNWLMGDYNEEAKKLIAGQQTK
jgi:short-subunit dehydrogenase